MSKVQQKILVYTDFSDISKKSLEWGIFLAKNFEKDILLIHVIDNNSISYLGKKNVEEKSKNILKEISEKMKNEENINSEIYVEEGCTCTIINSVAEKNDVFIVVLGTHGRNEIQFLSAVEIGKIIRKSRIPYFVVGKNSPSPQKSKNIVLPIDIRKENKEKTTWVSYFSKHISAQIKIIYPSDNDMTIKNNVFFCTKFFNELNLNYEKIIIKNSIFKNIEKKAVSFAQYNNGLMVVILTTKDSDIFNKFFGFCEDKIISNKEGIPILCINPKSDLYIPCL